MRVQQSTQVQVTTAIRIPRSTGWWKPLILVNGLDEETQKAFEAVFRMHNAPLVVVTEDIPDTMREVGDCLVQENSSVITVKGTGSTFMGLRFVTNWGTTNIGWREEVERRGCAWIGLLTAEQFGDVLDAQTSLGGKPLPAMPLLKLGAMFE